MRFTVKTDTGDATSSVAQARKTPITETTLIKFNVFRFFFIASADWSPGTYLSNGHHL